MSTNHSDSFNSGRAIGAILIDSGKLTPEVAEKVLRFSREKNIRFGDAAVQMQAVTKDDIDFALSRQFDYAFLRRGDKSVSDEVVAAFSPNSPAIEGLRALRTQLMLRWFSGEAGKKSIAIISPERSEGRSWLAANLAVVFSQLGERTLLIDGDMRNPVQHRLFNVDNKYGLSAILSGRANEDVVRRITPLVGLSVLSAGAQPPNAQELLSRAAFESLLGKLSLSFDVIIVDTPPAVEFADAQAIVARTGGALILAKKNTSSSTLLRETTDSVLQVGASVVGSALREG